MSEDDKKNQDMDALKQIYGKRLHDRKRFNNRWRMARAATPRPASELLGQLFKKEPETLKKIEQSRAMEAWPQMVGEAAAAVSKPLKINGHKLIVSVPDPMWRQQLILLRHKIISQYRRHFPKLGVRDIFFVA